MPGSPHDPRFHQANERTLLAWIRTAMGLMALGFVIARVGATPADDRAARLLGVLFVALGIALVALGTWRHRRTSAALRSGTEPVPAGEVIVVALLVAAVGVVLGAFLLRG
jgi:putative membrane protein